MRLRLSPRFLVKYLKAMSIIAIVSAMLDGILYIMIGFEIPSWAAAAAWFGNGLMFLAVAKLIEQEVKA